MARSCAAARPRTVPMGRHPGWGSWGPSSEVVCGSKLHTLAPTPLCFFLRAASQLSGGRLGSRRPPPFPAPRLVRKVGRGAWRSAAFLCGGSGASAAAPASLMAGGASTSAGHPWGGRGGARRYPPLSTQATGEPPPAPPPPPKSCDGPLPPPPSQWWRSGVPPHPEPCGYRGGRLRVPRHSPPFFLCRCRQWRGRGAVGYGGGGAGPPYATPMQAVCPPPPAPTPFLPLCPPAHLPRARRRALPLGRRRGWP